MSEDLVAFLRARLDEDERTAQATAAEWGAVWTANEEMGAVQSDTGADVVDDAAPIRYIARHDPARVLAEVAAKRRVIAWHDIPARAQPGPGLREHDRWCVGCGLNNEEEPMVDDINNCPVLRALALPHAQHPDYRPEWAPDA